MKFTTNFNNLFIIKLIYSLTNYFNNLFFYTSYCTAWIFNKWVSRRSFMYKPQNYADAYWFLYSNKKTLYTARFY